MTTLSLGNRTVSMRDAVSMLGTHLKAIVSVEFFTIPVYLTAVYSFTANALAFTNAQATGDEPESIWQVMAREKDIRYATRDDSHIARQKQIHKLRHVIRELEKELPSEKRGSAKSRELVSWGCGTTMHVVRLLAPALQGEDYLKDLDFSGAGIRSRCVAGRTEARHMIERAPWSAAVDPMEGVVVHELSARSGG